MRSSLPYNESGGMEENRSGWISMQSKDLYLMKEGNEEIGVHTQPTAGMTYLDFFASVEFWVGGKSLLMIVQ